MIRNTVGNVRQLAALHALTSLAPISSNVTSVMITTSCPQPIKSAISVVWAAINVPTEEMENSSAISALSAITLIKLTISVRNAREAALSVKLIRMGRKYAKSVSMVTNLIA